MKRVEDVLERGRAGPVFSRARKREEMPRKKWTGARIFPCLDFRVEREKESLREGIRRGSWTEGGEGRGRFRRREEKKKGKERGVVGERGREERTGK